MENQGFGKEKNALPEEFGAPPPPYSPELPATTTIQPMSNNHASASAPQPQVIQQIIYTTPPELGPDPMDITCGNCRRRVRSQTRESPNVVCCLLFGLWSCCCPGCQDVEHYCPHCNGLLGKYKPV